MAYARFIIKYEIPLLSLFVLLGFGAILFLMGPRLTSAQQQYFVDGNQVKLKTQTQFLEEADQNCKFVNRNSLRLAEPSKYETCLREYMETRPKQAEVLTKFKQEYHSK